MAEKMDLILKHLKVLRTESKQNREDVCNLKHHMIAIRNKMADINKGKSLS